MARIRTIKPEFFTSEDIVALTPFARLLYIALWCEADKEGRLVWKPKTFKMRYLPADTVNIDDLCAELVDSGLINLYGEGYAFIPAFHSHQHINPRESASQLPAPDSNASATRQPRVNHASPRDSDAQGGREGKGKEGNTRDAFVLPDWVPEKQWNDWLDSRKKKATVAAKNLNLSELTKLRDAGQDPKAVLEQATARGWTGLFPLKDQPAVQKLDIV